jgi:hypothetical protein
MEYSEWLVTNRLRQGARQNMVALDKLSPELVKELEEKATQFGSFEAFEAWIRAEGGHVWNGEPTGLSDGDHEEVKAIGTQYDLVGDFQDELARYAELAWGHARNAADPGPQGNVHLTGTSAAGESMPGDPNNPPWVTNTEGKTESGIVTTGEVDPHDEPQNDQAPAKEY